VADLGDDFLALVRTNADLHRALLAVGESIAEAAGQTYARSLCLQQIVDEPRTVASIATRLNLSRQGVQRVADLLVEDGLAVYADNPRHRRAQLLELTDTGRAALRTMGARHRRWVRQAAQHLGPLDIADTTERLTAILDVVRAVSVRR
jgi:DNA-binding MarR family transcriptional regulator